MADDKPGQLGRPTPIPPAPDQARLETVANPQPGTTYLVRFTCPEFTSLCPVTGQPDFAHLVIDYVPDRLLVESKSLKLFLAAFRNHGALHEDCTLAIAGRPLAARARRAALPRPRLAGAEPLVDRGVAGDAGRPGALALDEAPPGRADRRPVGAAR